VCFSHRRNLAGEDVKGANGRGGGQGGTSFPSMLFLPKELFLLLSLRGENKNQKELQMNVAG